MVWHLWQNKLDLPSQDKWNCVWLNYDFFFSALPLNYVSQAYGQKNKSFFCLLNLFSELAVSHRRTQSEAETCGFTLPWCRSSMNENTHTHRANNIWAERVWYLKANTTVLHHKTQAKKEHFIHAWERKRNTGKKPVDSLERDNSVNLAKIKRTAQLIFFALCTPFL